MAGSPAWLGLPQCPGCGHWVSYCWLAFVVGSGLRLRVGFVNPCQSWLVSWVGVFGLGLWCCPSFAGCLWCSWLGFGVGPLLGRVWFRACFACPPPFPVPVCGVGVRAGPGSRLCPALLGWVVGVCFLRFFFSPVAGCPCPGPCGLSPHPLSFGLGCWHFFFRGACLLVSVPLFPVGRCSWLGVAGFGLVVPLCLFGGPVFGALCPGGLAAFCVVGGRFDGCGLFFWGGRAAWLFLPLPSFGWRSLCGWCVVWLVPRHSWRRFLCATPRHSWLGFAAGVDGRSPPLLAGFRWRRWCVVCGVWWWCAVWLVPRHSWRRFLCATPRHSWLGFAAGGGGRSPPLVAGVRWRRWCVVCGVWCWCVVWLVPRHSWRRFLCATPRNSWLGFAAGVGGRSPPLLAGVRWRRWCVVWGVWWWCVVWLVPPHSWRRFLCATPRHSCLDFAAGGGGRSPPLLAAVRWRRWCVVCGVWRWCVGGVVVGAWCGWSLATPGGGSCVLLPATPGCVLLPLLVGGPRHSWLGSAGGGGGWCVVCGGGVLVGLWLVCGVVGPSPLLAEVPVC